MCLRGGDFISYPELQQIVDNVEQFVLLLRSHCDVADPALLPVNGVLPVLFPEKSLRAADLEFLGRSAAETHFAGLLFLLDCRFVENHPGVLRWKSDLRKAERVENKIGAVGELIFLPNDGIKRDVQAEGQNRHALDELSVGQFDRLLPGFVLSEAEKFDS